MVRKDCFCAQFGLALFLALLVATVDLARAQVVEFAIDSLSVSEGDAYAALPVTISQAPVGFAYVAYNTASGTADGGWDFTTTGGSVTWYAGESDTRIVYIGILVDMDPEENETFTVELSNPLGEATLGTRTTATVTIVDDDTGTVFLDVVDAFDPGTGKSYWVLPDPQADVPVALSSPAEAGGVAAGFASTLSPTSGTVPFDEGEVASSIHLDFPGGNSESNGEWIVDVGDLDLVSAPPGRNVGLPGSLALAWVRPVAARGGSACAAIVWCLIRDAFDYHGGCVDDFSLATDPLQTLRRYRDEVLSGTSVGQFYVDLYETHSSAAIDAMFASPSLAIRTIRAEEPWVDAIDALVNGNGDTAVVTPAMQDDLLSLLDAYASFGSPALASEIQTQRTQLQLDTISGLTMTQFQQQIETLGGASSVEPTSWSRIKSWYRSEP